MRKKGVSLYDKKGRLISGLPGGPAEHLIRNGNLKLPPVRLPRDLAKIFAYNPHLVQQGIQNIVYAVRHSFAHPDSAMCGDITQNEVVRRLQMCYEALLMGYYEMKMPIIQCLDTLPAVLVEAIRMGHTPEAVQATKSPGQWSVDAPADEMVAEAQNVAENQESEDDNEVD